MNALVVNCVCTVNYQGPFGFNFFSITHLQYCARHNREVLTRTWWTHTAASAVNSKLRVELRGNAITGRGRLNTTLRSPSKRYLMKIENKNAQFSVFFHRSYDYSRNLTIPLYMYLCEDTVWFDRSLHYISRMVWHWLFKLILFYCIHLVYTAYNIHTSSFFYITIIITNVL